MYSEGLECDPLHVLLLIDLHVVLLIRPLLEDFECDPLHLLLLFLLLTGLLPSCPLLVALL